MVTGYLLDTCIVGHYFTEHVNVVAKVSQLPDSNLLFVSAITLGEIAFGHHLSDSTNHHRREECDRFINNQFYQSQIVPVTKSTRMYYGPLKARLWRTFPPKGAKENHPERCFDRVTGSELGIDENDLWIASQAIERNLILVTSDEMKRIGEVAAELLDVEDWTTS